MRTDRSRFPVLRAGRPARRTLLGWKSVVTPKGRSTGVAVSVTPTPCMHRTVSTCSIFVRPDSESNMPALFDGLSTCSTHTHYRSPIRATNLEARLPPQQQHTAALVPVCPALHGKRAFRRRRPELSRRAPCKVRGADAAIGSPPPLSTQLPFSTTLRPSPCPALDSGALAHVYATRTCIQAATDADGEGVRGRDGGCQ